jgi:hypothetical protein
LVTVEGKSTMRRRSINRFGLMRDLGSEMENWVVSPDAEHASRLRFFKDRTRGSVQFLLDFIYPVFCFLDMRKHNWTSYLACVTRSLVASLTLALPLSMIATAVWSVPAYAGGTCSNFRNYHEGYASNAWSGSQPHWVEGVSAVMTDRSGYILCSGQNNAANFSTALVMMAATNLTGWDPVGTMYRFGDSCVTEWAQVQENNQNGFHDYYKPGACSSPGTVNTYWVQAFWTGSQYVYRSNVNSYVIHQTPWDPFVAWSAPFVTQVEAETTYPQSDIPGNASSPYDYDGITVQNYSNDAWADLCNNQNLGGVNGEDANFAEFAVHCDHIHTWTINP